MEENFSGNGVDKYEFPGHNDLMSKAPKRPPGPLFIALSGKKQVGKDSAAGFAKEMLETRGRRVGITAFAEVLKDVAINVIGLERNLVYGSNEDKETLTIVLWDNFPLSIRWKYRTAWYMPLRTGPMTVREVLQVMGTDIFRTMFENDIWANAPFHRDWSEYDVVLITDCRFPNEKHMTEVRGGLVVRLERDTGYTDTHASETALDNAEFDILFVQSKATTLDELRDFVRRTLREAGLL